MCLIHRVTAHPRTVQAYTCCPSTGVKRPLESVQVWMMNSTAAYVLIFVLSEHAPFLVYRKCLRYVFD